MGWHMLKGLIQYILGAIMTGSNNGDKAHDVFAILHVNGRMCGSFDCSAVKMPARPVPALRLSFTALRAW